MKPNETIAEARKRANMTQWKLAELLEIREETLSRKLRHKLPPEEVEKILKIIEEYSREKHEAN